MLNNCLSSAYVATIPAKGFKDIAKSGAMLTLKEGDLKLTFSRKAIAGIAEQITKELKICSSIVASGKYTKAEKAAVGKSQILDVYLESNGKRISNLGGSVRVTIPYKPTDAELKSKDGVTVYLRNSSGKLQKVSNCKYDPKTKTISFTTSKF